MLDSYLCHVLHNLPQFLVLEIPRTAQTQREIADANENYIESIQIRYGAEVLKCHRILKLQKKKGFFACMLQILSQSAAAPVCICIHPIQAPISQGRETHGINPCFCLLYRADMGNHQALGPHLQGPESR